MAEAIICWYCEERPAVGTCCSSHGKDLCHTCYRRLHFVDVCVEGCLECACEGSADRGPAGRPVTTPPDRLSDVQEDALSAFWTVVDNAANAQHPEDGGEALERIAGWVRSAMQRGLDAAVEAVATRVRAQIETCTVEDGGPCGQPAIAVARKGVASAFVCARDLPAIAEQGFEITPLPTLPDRDAVVRAQVAEEIRATAQKVRESTWTPSVGIALGAMVDELADKIAARPAAGTDQPQDGTEEKHHG